MYIYKKPRYLIKLSKRKLVCALLKLKIAAYFYKKKHRKKVYYSKKFS